MAEERVQRRLAAILAADMVGYSRLIEADEEGTRASLRKIQADVIDPQIAADGGRIVKTTGDGILVEFSSAVDAVKSAIAIQSAMAHHNADIPDDQQLVFRVGINLGDVIVEGEDIHGDGVNVAARLEGLCQPGQVYISGSVFDQVTGKIEAVFDDLGEQPIKNINRPVRVYSVGEKSVPETSQAGPSGALALPDKPSIAVLPFENMSGDPEQEYFADGIAEDVITALSHFHWFFVIARNSSFSYKGSSPDIRQVAKELGVHYVLEGSVRRGGNRVRITGQLIDAETGSHVWAERYDRNLEDIFDVQDEITEAIAGAVAPALVSAETRRVQRNSPQNLQSWDYAMRGTWHLWHLGPTHVSEAKRLFLEAIDLNPNNSVALSGYAFTLWFEVFFAWTADPADTMQTAFKAARQATASDQNDAWAQAVLGWLNVFSKEYSNAYEACDRALSLNPNLAFAEAVLALTYALDHHPDEMLLHADKADRLSPRDTFTLLISLLARGVSSFGTGDYEAHMNWSRRITELAPEYPVGWRHLAVACGHLGRYEEAERARETLISLVPHDSISKARATIPIRGTDHRERFLDGLRKAGLPEK
jgi:TolB-like protein